MKARHISLDEIATPRDAVRRIISVRFAEVLSAATALNTGRPGELHDLRISCKRLRYSIELFCAQVPDLAAAGSRVRQLQDELGEVHDCDVLSKMAKDRDASHLMRRLKRDRERHALRAKALWVDAFCHGGPFVGLIAFTGFGTPAQ